jgi:CYTH domain-containing protein
VTEIERKWRVTAVPPEAAAWPRERIDQGYLAIQADGGEVRVRRKGERCVLTVKSRGGLVRDEYEITLTPEQFQTLWPATAGRRVEKTRYRRDGIELDVYTGALAGLIVAEVEFASETEAAAYDPPPWFGEEVTDELRYRNSALAVDGRPD